jgi:hypothetical protein
MHQQRLKAYLNIASVTMFSGHRSGELLARSKWAAAGMGGNL